MNDKNYMPKINRIDYSRKDYIEEKYQNHLTKLKNKNVKIDEYILKTILKDNLFVITKNPFPYDIDYIDHYLVWINTQKKYSHEAIYNYIKFKFPNKQFYYFENDEKNKSVLLVKHYHIFLFKNIKKNINIYI